MDTKSIVLKKAGPSDLEKFLKWRIETLIEVFHMNPLLDRKLIQEMREANSDFFRRHIPDQSLIFLFAEKNGRTAGAGGICLYEEMPSPDNLSGKCAYLMNIYTAPGFRRQGIAEAIVADLIAEADRNQADKIYLETSDDGRPLYKKEGFVDLADMMILKRR